MGYAACMKTKICTKCEKRKRISQFTPKSKCRTKGYSSYCKPCNLVYLKERRKRDPVARQKANDVTRRRKQELRAEVSRIKSEAPCTDCGKTHDPWKMEFDHVRGIKLGNVSTMTNRSGWDKVMEEIAKCEIVCAFCHADRTHQRRQARLV